MECDRRLIFGSKVVFIGSAGTGKSSLIRKYMDDNRETTSTVGVEIYSINVDDGTRIVTLNVWDTAGSEQYNCVLPMYIRGAEVVVLVYDQNNPQSFDYIRLWYQILSEEYGIEKMIICCNKLDLEEILSFKEVKAWANEKKLRVIKTSAFLGKGITNLFFAITELVDTHSSFNPSILLENSESHVENCCV